MIPSKYMISCSMYSILVLAIARTNYPGRQREGAAAAAAAFVRYRYHSNGQHQQQLWLQPTTTTTTTTTIRGLFRYTNHGFFSSSSLASLTNSSSNSNSSSSCEEGEEESNHHHHYYQQYQPQQHQHHHQRTLPVGIFIDLDNVRPETYSRNDVQNYMQPFVHFFDNGNGKQQHQPQPKHQQQQQQPKHQQQHQQLHCKIQTLQAFGNRATQTYVTSEEKEAEFDQEWQLWDGAKAVTGYDETGTLRCGVCGARMKLTKKNKKAGMTVQDKLRKHMKELHDREQAKRINRYLNNNNGKKKKKKKGNQKKRPQMSEKEFHKYQKYNSAQIGLARMGLKGRFGHNNDLFKVLKEQGVKCYSAHDVDATLRTNAVLWMHHILRGADTGAADDNDNDDDDDDDDATIRKVGFLVVASEDSDFAPVLRKARANKFWAVSATPASMEQTNKLVQVSDMVLRRKQPYTIDEEYLSFGPYVIEPRSEEAIRLLQNVNFGDDNDDEEDSTHEEEEDGASSSDDDEKERTSSDEYSEKDEVKSSDEDDDIDDNENSENDNSKQEYRGESIPAHLRPLLNVKVTPNGLVNMTTQSTVETLPMLDANNKLPQKNRITNQLRNMSLEDLQQELEKRNLLDESIMLDRSAMTQRLRRVFVSDVVKVRLQEYTKLTSYQRPDDLDALFSILQQAGLVERKRSLAKMAVMVHCAEQGREMERYQPFEVNKTLKNLHGENLIRELEKRGISTSRPIKERKKQLDLEVEKERADHMDKLVRQALIERGESPKGDASKVCYRLVRSMLRINN